MFKGFFGNTTVFRTLLRRPVLIALPLLLCTLVIAESWQPVAAMIQQDNSNSQTPPAPATVDVDRIIRAFTAKETEFRRALAEYAFERDVTIQTIGVGGQVTGEYHRKSQFVFDDRDERFEKITYFPLPTLTELQKRKTSMIWVVCNHSPSKQPTDQYNFHYSGQNESTS